MTQWLKQNTGVKITVGPAVTDSDGVTAVTTAQTSAADAAELLPHDGSSGSAVALTTDNTFVKITGADGYYKLTLTSDNVSTLGMLEMLLSDADQFLPIRHNYMVVPANVYDAYFGSDKLQVHITEMDTDVIGATIIASDAIGADAIATDAITATKIAADAIGATQLATDAIGATQIASDAIGAEAIAADAIGASQIAANAIGASELATDAIGPTQLASDAFIDETFSTSAIDKIVDAVWDEILTGATHNIQNSAGKRLRTIDAAFQVLSGTASAGSTNTITLDTDASTVDNIYRGDRVIIVAGTGAQEHDIAIAYDGGTLVITVAEEWAVTPDNTSEYELVPASVDVETWQHAVVSTLTLIGAAEVNEEMLDVLDVDTFGESTGVPPATTTIRKKQGFIYQALRNRIDVSTGDKSFYTDTGAVQWKKPLTDTGVYTEGEATSP